MKIQTLTKRFSGILFAVILTISAIALPVSASETVEERIKAALKNKTSYTFAIADDYTFETAGGYLMNKIDGETFNTVKSEEWAQNSIKNFSSGYVVRIDNGVVSMGDSGTYTCTLTILESGGIEIEIINIDTSNASMLISGFISGNQLDAIQEYQAAFYFSTTNSSTGTYFYGKYKVGLIPMSKEDVAPQPVDLSYKLNRGDRTVTLKWTDTTPTGAAAYYEIYGSLSIVGDCELIAKVSDCTSWTDTRSALKESYRTYINYYVVSYSANGVASKKSNHLCIDVHFWH